MVKARAERFAWAASVDPTSIAKYDAYVASKRGDGKRKNK